MGYPTGTDLKNWLMAAGLVDQPMTAAQSRLDYDDAMDDAIEDWEERTGYRPFLADAVDETRVFDPPGPMQVGTSPVGLWTYVGGGWELDPGCGIVSLTSLTVSGTEYTLGSHFYLEPANAPAEGRPYDTIRFVWPVYGLPQSIAITGKFGFAAVLPKRVKQTLLKMAALPLVPSLQTSRLGGLQSWEDGDAKEVYGGKPYQTVQEAWETEIRKRVFFFKRKKIF